MNKLQKAWVLGATAVAAGAPLTAFAQAGKNPFDTAQDLVGKVGERATGSSDTQELPVIIGNIINVALGFLGIVLLAYLLYAGFLWMTAGGSDDQVTKAKDMIKNAIIGLIIIVAAFAISNFVLTSLFTATTTG